MKVRENFVLGLDLDGVCADYDNAFRTFVAEKFDVPRASLGLVTDWDYTKVGWGIKSRAHFEELHAEAVQAGMFKTMPAFPGVSEGLWRLSDAGIHIRVITHRLFIKGSHGKAAGDTVEWLELNNVPYRDLTFMANKVEVGADLYLDDSPSNVEKFRAGNCNITVFDQAYNRHLGGPRVHNWDEAVEHILEQASV